MERYGYIYGTDSVGEYTEIAASRGVRDFVQAHGTPFPIDALDQTLKILGGFEFLPGYEAQPEKRKPVSLCYAPVRLAGKYEMPGDMKPLYALCVSGMKTHLGKKMKYDALVTMDYNGLLQESGMNYLDQILGTHLISMQEVDELRRGGKSVDPSLPCERVAIPNRKDDSHAILRILEAVYTGKRVLIRLEKGYVFNQRALEILIQVYSLLHPRLAAEVGFATYQDAPRIRDLADEADIRIFLVPGEMDLIPPPANGIVVDLEKDEELNVTNMVKCLRFWQNLDPESRLETMCRVFGDPKLNVWDTNQFMVKTVTFFSDPFFKYKPVAGKCPTLEALKAEYERFAALKLDIPWVQQRFVKLLPTLLGPDVKLGELKARAAAELGSATDEEERKKYTELYRFAQKLDNTDASVYAVIQTRDVVQEQADAQCAEQKAAFESQISQMEASFDKTVAEQKTAHSKALASQKAEHDKAMSEQRASHQKALANQKTAHDKALADTKKTMSDELARAKATANSSSQQVTSLQKQIQDQKSSYEAEIRKLKNQAATQSKSGDPEQTAQLRKQMEELKKTHEAELAKLRAQRPVVQVSGSAKTVSERAKQMMAAQILWNLAQSEAQEARNQGTAQ